MYKRLELHNHTTESDSSITCQELIELMVKDKADAFAITDHNTISGHGKIRSLLEDMGHPIDCIYGMEYTTYYGHILCLNLQEYVPWENINLHKPELLFRAAREKGALTGVAHPFSYGHPFARGCRFDMKITDFSALDFIEIFNNPEPLHEVNERGLLWWESLVLKGHRLAMTCGMDLHGIWDMGGQFATYIPGEKGVDTARELANLHFKRTYSGKQSGAGKQFHSLYHPSCPQAGILTHPWNPLLSYSENRWENHSKGNSAGRNTACFSG